MSKDFRAAFGGDLPAEIYQDMEAAAAQWLDADAAESLLRGALNRGPEYLAVYFSLYKFYFYSQRLEEAENVAKVALEAAARFGDFDPDWRKLTPDSADWSDTLGPAHFFLFTLKALAMISLRRERVDTAREILVKLKALDPDDTTGASVIEALAGSC